MQDMWAMSTGSGAFTHPRNWAVLPGAPSWASSTLQNCVSVTAGGWGWLLVQPWLLASLSGEAPHTGLGQDGQTGLEPQAGFPW